MVFYCTLISNHSSVSDFIVNAINDGYYVYIYVETTCIKAYTDYGNEVARGHDLLIYGYDRGEELIKDTIDIKRSNMSRKDVIFEYSCVVRLKNLRSNALGSTVQTNPEREMLPT